MSKMAYPAIFRSGEFEEIDISNMQSAFLDVVDTPQRRRLVSQLRIFIEHLKSLGLSSFEMWIDGSFTTSKPDPSDMDVVCFIPRNQLHSMADENLKELSFLASYEGHAYVRERWNIDYYHCPFDAIDERNKWKEKFSTDAYGEAKGIGRIRV